MKCYY